MDLELALALDRGVGELEAAEVGLGWAGGDRAGSGWARDGGGEQGRKGGTGCRRCRGTVLPVPSGACLQGRGGVGAQRPPEVLPGRVLELLADPGRQAGVHLRGGCPLGAVGIGVGTAVGQAGWPAQRASQQGSPAALVQQMPIAQAPRAPTSSIRRLPVVSASVDSSGLGGRHVPLSSSASTVLDHSPLLLLAAAAAASASAAAAASARAARSDSRRRRFLHARAATSAVHQPAAALAPPAAAATSVSAAAGVAQPRHPPLLQQLGQGRGAIQCQHHAAAGARHRQHLIQPPVQQQVEVRLGAGWSCGAGSGREGEWANVVGCGRAGSCACAPCAQRGCDHTATSVKAPAWQRGAARTSADDLVQRGGHVDVDVVKGLAGQRHKRLRVAPLQPALQACGRRGGGGRRAGGGGWRRLAVCAEYRQTKGRIEATSAIGHCACQWPAAGRARSAAGGGWALRGGAGGSGSAARAHVAAAMRRHPNLLLAAPSCCASKWAQGHTQEAGRAALTADAHLGAPLGPWPTPLCSPEDVQMRWMAKAAGHQMQAFGPAGRAPGNQTRDRRLQGIAHESPTRVWPRHELQVPLRSIASLLPACSRSWAPWSSWRSWEG